MPPSPLKTTESASSSSSDYETVSSDSPESVTVTLSDERTPPHNTATDDGMTTPTHSRPPTPPTARPEQQPNGISSATDANLAAIPLVHIPSPPSSSSADAPSGGGEPSTPTRISPASPRNQLQPRQHKLSNGHTPSNPEAGWDEDTPTNGMVIQYGTSNEISRHIITKSSASLLGPAPTPNSGWLFSKIFADDSFSACGRIHILPGGAKLSKSVKDNTYMFYVIEGAVHAKIHETRYTVCSDGLFMVPRGNTYRIDNISARTAKLLFFQAREVSAGESDENDPLLMRNSLHVPSLPTKQILTAAAIHLERTAKTLQFFWDIVKRWYTRTSFEVGRRFRGRHAWAMYILLGFVLRGLFRLRGSLRSVNVQAVYAPPLMARRPVLPPAGQFMRHPT